MHPHPHTAPNEPRRLNALVHSVIWPAVAGSILWTLLQLAIDPRNSGPSLWPRCLALLSVGVYLAVDWVSTEAATTINAFYWVADIPLAASLSIFAIATQFNVPWAGWWLVAAFGIAIIGHLVGAWDPNGSGWHLWVDGKRFGVRATLTTINALGIGVLLVGTSAKEPYWSRSLAIALVVVVYLTWNPVAKKWLAGRAARSQR